MKKHTPKRQLRPWQARLRFESLEQRVVLDSHIASLIASDFETAAEAPAEVVDEFSQFADAEELQTYLVDAAVERFQQLFGESAWPGFWPPIYTLDDWSTDFAISREDVLLADSNGYGTNVQVDGVDEGDIVKTDGDHLYYVGNREIVIVDVSRPDDLRVASRVLLDRQPSEIYVHENRLTVISHSYSPFDEPWPIPLVADTGDVFNSLLPWAPPVPTRLEPAVQVRVYDIADPEAPSLVQEMEIDGRLTESRARDGFVYLVTQEDVGLPAPIFHCEPEVISESADAEGDAELRLSEPYVPMPWVESGCVYETQEEYLARLDGEALEALPAYRVSHGDSVTTQRLFEPQDIYRFADGNSNLVSVIVLDVGAEQPEIASTAGGFADNINHVYMAGDAIYLSGTKWVDDHEVTRIYQVDLAQKGRTVELVAKGDVPGRPLNQFAFDAFDGHLRVATTEGWGDNAANHLFVLEKLEHELFVLGSLENLAPGERIYAANFSGDQAFLVTFRRVDPLFAINLEDPAFPTLEGELEITGFSNYLHEVEPGILVGLGRNADDTGRVQNPQLSLFDVRDLDDPTLVDRFSIMPDVWGGSEAFHNHHAINYLDAEGILVVPFQFSGWSAAEGDALRQWNSRNEFWVFQVNPPVDPVAESRADADGPVMGTAAETDAVGIQLLSRIEHDSSVRRSLQIEDYLFTLSTETIKVHDLANLDDPVDELTLVNLAVNDEFTVDNESVTARLDVLANDRNRNDARITEVTTPDSGGQVTIEDDGRVLMYSPSAGFLGQETFTYTAQGQTAEVVVNVIQEEDVVQVRIEAVDSAGEPIASVQVGQEFDLRVWVEDLRADAQGVFSAYVDLTFDGNLVEVAGEIQNGSLFGNGLSGDAESPGLIDELGGFSSFQRTGSGELLLTTVPMVALQHGEVSFAADPADVIPRHEFGLYGLNDPVSSTAIHFVDAALQIDEGFHNALDPTDTNGDGETSPLDALAVINYLNEHGTLSTDAIPMAMSAQVASFDGESRGSAGRFFFDVNSDRFVSPLDALAIINHLNEKTAAAAALAEGEAGAGLARHVTEQPTMSRQAASLVASRRSVTLDDADLFGVQEDGRTRTTSLDALLATLAEDQVGPRPQLRDAFFATLP